MARAAGADRHLQAWQAVLPFACLERSPGVPVVAQWKRTELGTMRTQVRSLASLSGLRIRHCRELWCRL